MRPCALAACDGRKTGPRAHLANGKPSARSLAWASVLSATLVLLTGCGGVPLGPVSPPEYYPDRTEHTLTLQTFFWASNQGDIDVLQLVLGALLYQELANTLKTEKKEDVAAWYRRDADGLTIEDVDWTHEGEALAYARVVLRVAGRRHEEDFSLLRRPDGWVVSGRKPRR